MSLVLTRLQNLRVASPGLDQYTLLMPRYGALSAFLEGNQNPGGIISPQLLQQAASAVGRSVEIPVFDSETVTIGSTRSVTIADDENTSKLYTVSFTTYAWGFTVTPSLHLNNEVGIQQDFNRKFLKYLYKFLTTLDISCLSALNAAKNQVYADLLGIYTDVGDTIDVPLARHDEIIGDLTPIMNAMDFYGQPYKIIGNTGIQSLILKLAEKGIYNVQNKTIQYADKDFRFTNNLANATDKVATGYCIEPGAVGMLFRHEREALLGTMLPDGTEWGIETLPGGLPVSTYFYHGVGDYSAIAGAASADMTRAAKEHYGWSVDVATITPYNTDLATYSNPIAKFQLANS